MQMPISWWGLRADKYVEGGGIAGCHMIARILKCDWGKSEKVLYGSVTVEPAGEGCSRYHVTGRMIWAGIGQGTQRTIYATGG